MGHVSHQLSSQRRKKKNSDDLVKTSNNNNKLIVFSLVCFVSKNKISKEVVEREGISLSINIGATISYRRDSG
jgi:hypothetical protein